MIRSSLLEAVQEKDETGLIDDEVNYDETGVKSM